MGVDQNVELYLKNNKIAFFMKQVFVFIILLYSFAASGQHTINGTVSGLVNEEVYLLRIIGDSRKIVDTAFTDMTGSFEMKLEKDFPVGLYAIVAGPEQMIELIYNNENIRFITSGNTPDAQVQIVESIENLIYYDYLSLKGITLYKLDLLEPVLQYYPRDDDFYIETLFTAKMLQTALIERTNQLINENPGTLVSHFIVVDQPVFANPELDSDMQKEYMKQHYFDNTDFSDTLLIYSNILTSRIVQYLSLYQVPGLTQEQMEDRLMIAVDTVLEKAFVDQQVYEYVIDFLISGFDAIGFERGLEHIAEHNMLTELCVNSERKAELENKMELIKKLAIGKTAPDFETTDLKGEKVKLSEIRAERTVLFFWASWCPHCEEMLPELKKLFNPSNIERLQVIGISIDELKDDLEASIKEHKLEWINIGELKGWNGPIADEYGIVATPTLFVLDKNKTIISKPRNIEEMKNALKQ